MEYLPLLLLISLMPLTVAAMLFSESMISKDINDMHEEHNWT